MKHLGYYFCMQRLYSLMDGLSYGGMSYNEKEKI